MSRTITLSCLMIVVGYLLFALIAPPGKVHEATPVEAKIVVASRPKSDNQNDAGKSAVERRSPTDEEVLIAEVSKYDWDTKIMLAIAKAESNWRKDAVGDTDLTYRKNGRVYGYSVGVFQIRVLEGREACDTFDIATNVSCAYRVYRSQGLRAWSVYTNGKYTRYL